ncbi:MAG: YdcF family protein [Nanoarchaeota archaeon]
MNKNKIGLFFLLSSLVLILIPSSYLSLTGNAIAEIPNSSYSYLQIIGLALFALSILIFTSGQSLDAIIVPTGPSVEEGKERADRAGKEYKEHGAKVLIISGNKSNEEDKKQRYAMYQELRKYGIQPRQIKIEGQSKNTIENVVNSLKKIKELGGREIGIASNPSHLDRFEYIVKRGKAEGIIDKEMNIHRLETQLETQETFGKSVYGFLANMLNRYKLRHGIKNANQYQTPSLLRKAGKYIFGK